MIKLRYSDIFDKILLTLGTLAAVLSGVIYPIMFLMFGTVAATLINFTKKEDGLSSNASDFIKKW